MNTIEKSQRIVQEIETILNHVQLDQVDTLMAMINQANRIFVMGAGRTRLMLNGFAMRLMQIGYPVFVVGEIVTPALATGDLLLIGSGTGETSGLVLNAQKAKKIGADIALITTNPDSTLGILADHRVIMPTFAGKGPSQTQSFQPGGNAFEQCLLILCDAIAMTLIENLPAEVNIMNRHANLE